MAASLSPELLQELFTLRERINAAPHGEATEIVRRFAEVIGRNPNTILRRSRFFGQSDKLKPTG